MIPLTKTYDPIDYLLLRPELAVVNKYFSTASEQHHARRWEYSMALKAVQAWEQGKFLPDVARPQALDVGGAGSPFSTILASGMDIMCNVVDPKSSIPLEEWERPVAALTFCISVIEHVEDLHNFVYHLGRITVPGGLLFLTMDIWDPEDGSDIDKAHFHWMRKRIFKPATWKALADTLHELGFSLLGEADWDYAGVELEPGWGYSFASLAMVKDKPTLTEVL